jgi:copper chaperone CopZ
MTVSWKKALRAAVLTLVLYSAAPAQAEYLHIQLKVYGLDCEICARGVSASVGRMEGVENIGVSLKTGMLEISLKRGNMFKMSDLRKRIKENGFRAMEAKVTAIGSYSGSKFYVLGAGESYNIGNPATKDSTPTEVTFDVK